MLRRHARPERALLIRPLFCEISASGSSSRLFCEHFGRLSATASSFPSTERLSLWNRLGFPAKARICWETDRDLKPCSRALQFINVQIHVRISIGLPTNCGLIIQHPSALLDPRLNCRFVLLSEYSYVPPSFVHGVFPTFTFRAAASILVIIPDNGQALAAPSTCGHRLPSR